MSGEPLALPSEEQALITAAHSLREQERRRRDLEQQHQDAQDLAPLRAELAVPRG